MKKSILLTAVALNLLCAKAYSSEPSNHPVWEYKIIASSVVGGIKHLTKELNKLGVEGWELVAVVDNGSPDSTLSKSYYFKRLVLSNNGLNTNRAEGGADQPATAPESKPEGAKKLKPESEERSQ